MSDDAYQPIPVEPLPEAPGVEPGDDDRAVATPNPGVKGPADKYADKTKAVDPEPFPDPRAGIYAKGKNRRPASASIQDDTVDQPTEILKRRMEMESAGVPPDDQMARLREEFGDETGDIASMFVPQDELEDGPEATDQAKPQAKPQASDQQTVDTGADQWVTIQVDGREQYATAEEVEEAGGVAQLQKQRAADARLEAAAVLQNQAKAELEEIRRDRERLLREAEASATATTPPPQGGSPGQVNDLDRRVEEYAQALLSGDEDETRAAVRALLTAREAAQAQPQAKPAQPAPEATAPTQPQLSQEQAEANGFFRGNFQDLAVRDDLMPVVRQRIDYLRTLPGGNTRSLVDIVKDAGAYVRRNYIGPGDTVSVLPASEIRERVTSKRAAGGPTGSGRPTERAKAPPPATRADARRQAIADIKKSRGQS